MTQFVILLREPDGRVVTLVEPDAPDSAHRRTCLFDSEEEADEQAKAHGMPWAVVEAP